MDADTELHPKFIERAGNVLASDPALGGVKGLTADGIHQVNTLPKS
jgi:hypothetical protein